MFLEEHSIGLSVFLFPISALVSSVYFINSFIDFKIVSECFLYKSQLIEELLEQSLSFQLILVSLVYSKFQSPGTNDLIGSIPY